MNVNTNFYMILSLEKLYGKDRFLRYYLCCFFFIIITAHKYVRDDFYKRKKLAAHLGDGRNTLIVVISIEFVHKDRNRSARRILVQWKWWRCEWWK